MKYMLADSGDRREFASNLSFLGDLPQVVSVTTVGIDTFFCLRLPHRGGRETIVLFNPSVLKSCEF